MTDSLEMFVEGKIVSAVKRLLAGRVNEILGEYDFAIPEIEFGNYAAGNVVVPVVTLALCERTEKERLIFLDAYSLAISFTLPETPESELCCYAYAASVEKVFREDKTLGGDCSIVINTSRVEMDVPYSSETLRKAVSMLYEEPAIEGNGTIKAIRKPCGVTGCVVTPLTIGTTPLLLYLVMGSAGLPCLFLKQETSINTN